MLSRALAEIERAGGALQVNELSRRLGVEPSAMECMLQHLLRRGKLKAYEPQEAWGSSGCSGCSRSCPGAGGCPSGMKMPRTYSLVR